MICHKCGEENNEESLFCNKCGTKIGQNNKKIVNKLYAIKDKLKLYKNKRNGIILCSVLVIIAFSLAGIFYFNNPVSKFKSEIRNNKPTEAMQLYRDSIKADQEKVSKITQFLKDEIATNENLFIDEKIDFDKAKTVLEPIKSTSLVSNDVSESLNKINKLNDSRIAFNKAEEFVKNNDLVNALKEYKNVISEDKNYEKANTQITNYKQKYKEQVLKNAEDCATSKDFNKAISLLKEASYVIEKDADLTAKLSVYSQQQLEKTKSEQLVIVESARIVVQSSQWKSLYPDMIQVIVVNKSEKTIKDMEVSSVAFDQNNYPLKIKAQFSFSDTNYEFIGNAPNVNIIPGARFGDNVGWNLDESHGISKVLSCIKTVTFYDGTIWDNPYYKYWIEQYKEKPLSF